MSSIIIQNGRVIDPAQNLDGLYDVRVQNGRIAEISSNITASPGDEVIDASGKIVIPGMVDLHSHVYGGIGIEPDCAGIYTGVTTLVDAGSCGALTFLDFLAATENAKTNVLSVLFVEAMGATDFKIHTDPKELGSLQIATFAKLIEQYPDKIKGFKSLALSDLQLPWVKMTKLLSEWFHKPTYYHIGNFRRNSLRIPMIAEMLSFLGKGDIITHCYTSEEGGLIVDGKPYPELLDALDRGLHLDLGHGKTGFSFESAKILADAGIYPHSISSDVNTSNLRTPVKNITYVMSKMLALGFTLEQIVPMVTINPAKVIHIDHMAGTMKPGYPADISILQVETGEWTVEDTERNKLTTDKMIVPWKTLKDGIVYDADVEKMYEEENHKFNVDRANIPDKARMLDQQQKDFLNDLLKYVKCSKWEPELFQQSIHSLAAENGISLSKALEAIYISFGNRTFGPQAGWFLSNQCHSHYDFVVHRLQEVVNL